MGSPLISETEFPKVIAESVIKWTAVRRDTNGKNVRQFDSKFAIRLKKSTISYVDLNGHRLQNRRHPVRSENKATSRQ